MLRECPSSCSPLLRSGHPKSLPTYFQDVVKDLMGGWVQGAPRGGGGVQPCLMLRHYLPCLSFVPLSSTMP